jgi:2-polyprenyl-3-methyl-5-hydroxy-6-metoxy-1,4-benzoquinol methylase
MTCEDKLYKNQILEHLAYPATLLKQLLQVLSPEGGSGGCSP